jgi:hypothetical protein
MIAPFSDAQGGVAADWRALTLHRGGDVMTRVTHLPAFDVYRMEAASLLYGVNVNTCHMCHHVSRGCRRRAAWLLAAASRFREK